MKLHIEASLSYWFPAKCEVLLLVEAAHSPDQTVLEERLTIMPTAGEARLDCSDSGERRMVFQAQGNVKINYAATVAVLKRDEGLAGAAAATIRDLPQDALPYLRASRFCPSDRFELFVTREFSGLRGGDKVEAILAWIAGHMDYRLGVSDGTTTALDSFVDRAGVCRDFAHLAITLCRAADIPARAVSVYAWKLEPPDLHGVAEVYVGGRWRMIDPTGLAPLDGLVRVATGRDASDIAFMTIFGAAHLNEQSFTVREAE